MLGRNSRSQIYRRMLSQRLALERLLSQVLNNRFIQDAGNLRFRGFGVLLNENSIHKVISLVRLNHRLMPNHIMVHKVITNICNVYAPQAGLSVNGKALYLSVYLIVSKLLNLMSICQCTVISMAMQEKPYDFNRIHDGLEFASCNTDGIRMPTAYSLQINIS